MLLRGSIIWDQTSDGSVLENQFLSILFAFGHSCLVKKYVLIFEVFIHGPVDGCINGSIILRGVFENNKELSSLTAVNVLITNVQLSIEGTVLQI